LRRLHRLAAAVPDDESPAQAELIALGVAAKVVVVIENEDARAAAKALPVEPGGREPADAAADHHEIVALLDRQPVERERLAIAQIVADLERARMLPAQAGEGRRIAQRLRGELVGRGESGCHGQGEAVEEVAAADTGHTRQFPQSN